MSADPIRGTVTALGSTTFGHGRSEVGIAEVNGVLCLFATGKEYEDIAKGTCPSIKDAEAGLAYIAIPGFSPGVVRVVGLAPNGVSSIEVGNHGDKSIDQRVSVPSNLYQLNVKQGAISITGVNNQGTSMFTIKIDARSPHGGHPKK